MHRCKNIKYNISIICTALFFKFMNSISIQKFWSFAFFKENFHHENLLERFRVLGKNRLS